LLGGGQGGPLSGESGADYQYVMRRHERGLYRAEIRPRGRISASEPALVEAADRCFAEADAVGDGVEVDVLG
jgi:hypothetical protein